MRVLTDELICIECAGESVCMWIPSDRLVPGWEMLLRMIEHGTAASA